MTTERKIYGAILTLAMTGLGGTFWPSSSTGAGTAAAAVSEAAQVSSEPAGGGAGGAVAVVKPQVASGPERAMVTVSQRLRKLQNQDVALCVDAFAPLHVEHVQVAQVDLDSAAFKTSHQLGGVVLAGKRSYAIVNGKAVRLGETVAGFKLVELKGQTAVFEGNGNKISLAMNAAIASGN